MKAGIPGERNIPMEQTSESRNRTIIRCNKAGILLNFILSAAKLAIGFLIGSRAVVLDAVNGRSDMISSLISIISTVYAESARIGSIPWDMAGLNTFPPCLQRFLSSLWVCMQSMDP